MLSITIDGQRWGVALPNADGDGNPSNIFGRRSDIPELDDRVIMHYDEIDERGFWTDSCDGLGMRLLVAGNYRNPQFLNSKAMFRPVFIPLDKHGRVDADALSGMKEGDIVKVACIKEGDKLISQTNKHVPKYKGGELSFVSTSSANEKYHILAMRVGDELLATRNVLSGISFEELAEKGFERNAEETGERQIVWLDGKPWQVNLPRANSEPTEERQDTCDALDSRPKPRAFQESKNYLSILTRTAANRDPRGILLYLVYQQSYFDAFDTSTGSGDHSFAPDFIPLDETTMKPDREYLETIEDGRELALATLYINGSPVPIAPQDDKAVAAYRYQEGDVIEFRPLDPELPEEYYITVFKFGYLCASVFPLVSNVSYSLLRKLGFAREAD